MDMHTLHIEHAVLLGVYTILTVANSWLHRGTKGLQWFPVYNFYAFVGAILVASRGDIPDWISIVFGTLFFSLAYVVLHRSLTEFLDRGAQGAWTQWLLCGLALVVLVRYGVVTPNTRLRLLGYSLILAAQTGLTAVFVFQNAVGIVRSSGWMMGSVLCMLCINNLTRAAATLMHGAPENYLQGGRVISWVLVGTSVLQGGGNGGLRVDDSRRPA